jgi:ribosome-associated toxin RatA of RatAB toxin-antitoxin module
MREMIAEKRFEDLVTGTVRLVDAIVERHTKQMLDAFKRRARELYGRRSE